MSTNILSMLLGALCSNLWWLSATATTLVKSDIFFGLAFLSSMVVFGVIVNETLNLLDN